MLKQEEQLWSLDCTAAFKTNPYHNNSNADIFPGPMCIFVTWCLNKKLSSPSQLWQHQRSRLEIRFTEKIWSQVQDLQHCEIQQSSLTHKEVKSTYLHVSFHLSG